MILIVGLLTISINVLLSTLTYASVGYGDNHGLGDHHNIDLGTFVGKHTIPPKVIRITKTVAVKVPVPYPVKVPVRVPYPVPYPKPYPVHVPKIVKVREEVPVYIPGPSKPAHQYHSDASEHYTSENVQSPQVEVLHGGNNYPVIQQSEQYYVPQQFAGALKNQGYNFDGQKDAQQYGQYSEQPKSEIELFNGGHNQQEYEGSNYQQQQQQQLQDYSRVPLNSHEEYTNYQPSGAEHN